MTEESSDPSCTSTYRDDMDLQGRYGPVRTGEERRRVGPRTRVDHREPPRSVIVRASSDDLS